MIITQTPLRVGLVGGGTDLPGYYREHGGRVLNAAIDKYVYVIVKQRFDDDIYVNYSRKEIVSRVEDLQHELVREAMHMTGVRSGVEITTLADIPSAGSGLGSSSAVTVGLLHALFAYQGRQVTAEELAERACAIEIDRCRKPIGKQDQYAAAFGGICDLRFGPGDRVDVEQITPVPSAAPADVQTSYCSSTPGSPGVRTPSSTSSPRTSLTGCRSWPSCGTWPARRPTGCAAATSRPSAWRMNKSWEAKRSLASGVSNAQIDEAVERALAAGATGAKVTGAGGGGFLLVVCPLERQRAVREGWRDMRELPIKIDPSGSRIVFNVTVTSGVDRGTGTASRDQSATGNCWPAGRDPRRHAGPPVRRPDTGSRLDV